jgi:acetate kinase
MGVAARFDRFRAQPVVNVLVLNCGSATLKFDVVSTGQPAGSSSRTSGLIDPIGHGAMLTFKHDGQQLDRKVSARGYAEGLDAALGVLNEAGVLKGIEAVGHRVVHGGLEFREATRRVSDLAPLHNARSLEVIEAARERLDLPMVACFDTAFYADLPRAAATYALPAELTKKHGIRRFGFHGLAHGYMTKRYRELRPEVAMPRLITLQLGSGCSATASIDGRAIQTSMGYTPLEGLVMGTRSGNIDPALALRLPGLAGLAAGEVEDMLNKQSGLLGISGRSADMRELLEGAKAGDEACELAIEVFASRTKEYVGAYMALLNGADAIVFGGGIGEHGTEARHRVVGDLDGLGIGLDEVANESTVGREGVISAPGSRVEVWVVAVDEGSEIARETARVLG